MRTNYLVFNERKEMDSFRDQIFKMAKIRCYLRHKQTDECD